MKSFFAAIAAVAGLALAAGHVARAAGEGAGASGSVTFLMGEASRSAGGKVTPLALGSLVYEGDVIETKGRTRLEVKLPDKSVVRIGPQSKVALSQAVFGKTPEDRKVAAKVVQGNIWAKVAHAVGGEAKFEVQTQNAVAGVRGTTFRVDAKTDKSCVVKVYNGTVAVAAGAIPRPIHEEAKGANGKAQRVQVSGPQAVSREQWEKIVTSMMQVRVGADGRPGEPESFALSSKDDWEDWNRQRDEKG